MGRLSAWAEEVTELEERRIRKQIETSERVLTVEIVWHLQIDGKLAYETGVTLRDGDRHDDARVAHLLQEVASHLLKG